MTECTLQGSLTTNTRPIIFLLWLCPYMSLVPACITVHFVINIIAHKNQYLKIKILNDKRTIHKYMLAVLPNNNFIEVQSVCGSKHFNLNKTFLELYNYFNNNTCHAFFLLIFPEN